MLAHGGAYVVGARRDDGTLVGVTLGVFVEPLGKALHSHLTGAVTAAASQGVGRALKLHQRAWARVRGMQAITWTYDPLVARNAYFNLVRLGARPIEYLVDFYGTLGPATVPGQESDRVLVSWDITAAPTARTAPTAHGTSAGATAERGGRGRWSAAATVSRCAPSHRDATTLLVAVPTTSTRCATSAPSWSPPGASPCASARPLIDDGWTAADFTRRQLRPAARPRPAAHLAQLSALTTIASSARHASAPTLASAPTPAQPRPPASPTLPARRAGDGVRCPHQAWARSIVCPAVRVAARRSGRISTPNPGPCGTAM